MSDFDHPPREYFFEEYCGFCCHYHAPDVECDCRIFDGTLQGDICMCVSTLAEREDLLREIEVNRREGA